MKKRNEWAKLYSWMFLIALMVTSYITLKMIILTSEMMKVSVKAFAISFVLTLVCYGFTFVCYSAFLDSIEVWIKSWWDHGGLDRSKKKKQNSKN